MPFQVSRTTAEHVVAATDAALQKPAISRQEVAQFLDIPEDAAAAALAMAEQLGFLTVDGDRYIPLSPYAHFLVTSDRQEKAAVLRLVLEQYAPYRTFRTRLALEGLVPQAANQTKALHGIAAHRDIIVDTFVNLGTYANSLVSEGAGLFRAREEEQVSFLATIAEVVQSQADAELVVRRRLGQTAERSVDYDTVLAPLVTAYQRLGHANEDATAPVVHAANAVESYLVQVAAQAGVNIAGADGINAKADRLFKANTLSKKHLNMLKYLGHVRNAADHGIDQDVNAAWEITPNTAIEYVHVAQTTIAACVAFCNGTHTL